MIISTAKKPSAVQCTPTFSSWKLYDNPLFALHPSSTRKLCPKRSHKLEESMTGSSRTEMGSMRTQIVELKRELKMEHMMRKKMESLAKKMIKSLAEERRGREAAERLCFELAKRVRSKGRDQ